MNIQLFGGRGGSSRKIRLHRGRQNKHDKDHNNYKEGNSIITIPYDRIEKLVRKYGGKEKKQRERVDFGEIIGKYYDDVTKKYYDTTRGSIHWGKDGIYHVVPAMPEELLKSRRRYVSK